MPLQADNARTMKRTNIAGLAVSAVLVAAGGTAGAAAGGAFSSGPAPGSADGGQCAACAPAGVKLHRVMRADPSLDAQCTIEPNGIPPYCVQGSFQVALALGGPCGDPSNVSSIWSMTWQQTYAGSSDVRCMPATQP